jgi:hypothetical protein
MSPKATEKASEPTSRTVYHPSFADVSRVVPAADVEAWTDQGWRLTPPTN